MTGKCFTYCPELIYQRDEEVWNLEWNFLECPHTFLTFRKGTFQKACVSEKARLHATEECLLFTSDKGEVALPNDFVTVEVLKAFIEYAESIQKPFEEGVRIEQIRLWKKLGFLDKDSSEDSPVDKNYLENSLSNQRRKEIEEILRSKNDD